MASTAATDAEAVHVAETVHGPCMCPNGDLFACMSVTQAVENNHKACLRVQIEKLKKAKKAREQKNKQYYGAGAINSGLEASIKRNHLQCLSILLAANTPGVWGYFGSVHTPLQYAILYGSDAAVEVVWAATDDLNTRGCSGTVLHTTGLPYGPQPRLAKWIPRLVAAGADVDNRSAYGNTPLLQAVDNHDYRSPTHVHILVTAFLREGASLHATNYEGQTPVQVAHARGLSACEATLQDEARWRRRRALALVREQRRAARDHQPYGPWRGPPQATATAPAAGRQRVR
jgi:hypothetical protein